ncbi:MAG: molybdopterin cofactor-binding domain-containing protein [Woeseiaceae bacterium]|nr:molybdopterin cofactor-binding domain-containing protein [Woeseiaceae bacterium]
MAIGGSSLHGTVAAVIEQGRNMAAVLLDAAGNDIEFDNGQFHIAGTDRTIGIVDVAQASLDDARRPPGVKAGLASSERFQPEDGTFPNGCHVCEVEVDPDTGTTQVLRYTIVDDVGVVINPLILEGQIVGGAAQGLGQALGEHAAYESDSGQLLAATFMDYPMPRADWVPEIDFHYREVSSPRNPLGVKGAGEAGTVGAAPAVINAIIDALAARGITHIDMPGTPQRIWRVLQKPGLTKGSSPARKEPRSLRWSKQPVISEPCEPAVIQPARSRGHCEPHGAAVIASRTEPRSLPVARSRGHCEPARAWQSRAVWQSR